MKVLCAFGKHQYGDSSRGLSTEYFSFYKSLKALGHDVKIVDIWNKSLYADSIDLNESLVKECIEFDPDIIFASLLLFEVWMETFDYVKQKTGSTLVHWCSDDSWKYKQQSKFISKHFDYMVSTYPEFEEQYKKQGVRVIISGWACPDEWIDYLSKETEYVYDVSFVGTAHGSRREYVLKLKNKGVNVNCFGKGWEKGPIKAEDIPKVFKKSRINLNFANSLGDNQIKARTFEVPGSGGFLLTEYTKGLEDIYDTRAEIETFSSVDECVKKITYFLNESSERYRITKAGNKRTIREYTYTKRMKAIIDRVDLCGRENIESGISEFNEIVKEYKVSWWILVIRRILITLGISLFGKARGPRFARRLVYEISWRLFGKTMYTTKSLVGRMFYEE